MPKSETTKQNIARRVFDTAAVDQFRTAYDPAVYQRLTNLKQKYDPNNLFHLNQNIKPASGTLHPQSK